MANNNDKNFEQFLANPTNYSDYKSPRKSIDPNLFANKELQHQIVKDSQKQYVVNLIKSAILSVVVAPLTTIHTSLQLSVIPHQNKYGDIPNPTQPSTTALTKTTKDIKPHDKRKFELLIKSGAVGNNKPFRAPVYISYYEAIKGLSNQGFLGFYKGNMLGLFYFAVNSNLKLQFLSQMDFGMSNVWHQGNQFIRQCIVLSLCSFAEIITNPIMLFQSRFILQNRLPNFYLYKSFPAAIKKHLMNKREYFKGASTHIYKNISIFLLQMPINWAYTIFTFLPIMNRIQQLNNQINSTNGEDDIFSHITQAPADPIFGISMAYKADKSDLKIDLGVGAYRTDEEKPYIFEIVKKVEREIVNDTSLNKEYLPIDGIADYCKLTQQLVFGKTNPILAQGKVISAQALGGTGALRMGFDFIKKHIPADVYVSKPTWSNHLQVVERAGLNVLEYPYFDPKTNGFNLKGMLDTLSQARMGSVVLLHVCAHNPTGVDPTQEEWLKIADVCRRRRLVPFFDSAYQGFASGDLQQDAYSVRKFAELGFQMLVAQSFSKNMGLYNERVGALHIVASTKDIASKVQSQLKIVIRTAYSNPSAHGGRIATRILGNEANYQAWVDELKVVTGRIIKMRTLLKQELDQLKVPGNWSHITTQTGFFTFTGLTVQQCEKITSKHHVYMLKNGRMSMAGITTKNVKALAKAIQDVVVQ